LNVTDMEAVALRSAGTENNTDKVQEHSKFSNSNN